MKPEGKASVLRFGMMGLNAGNGHPYSFSAIFNGFDETALADCPFPTIRTYLADIHQNRHIIPDARVTHLWTQDVALSHQVARLAKIPNVVSEYNELIGEIDALITCPR